MNLLSASIVFWLSFVGILHTYVIFPLVISLWAKIRGSHAGLMETMEMDPSSLPSITVLIAAFNEERTIRERVKNLADCSYPKDKMTVMIGSDGSTDATNALLEELSTKYPWLHVVFFTENRGKAEVLNALFPSVSTPISVFTDADTVFSLNALEELVEPFREANVGCVAGLRLVRNSALETVTEQQEKSYLNLDNKIRRAEGALGCVIGAHGSLFALRTELIRPLPSGKAYTDDFYWSMIPLELGFNVVQSMEALSYAESAPSVLADFRRKVRYASTAFATGFRFIRLLWTAPAPVRYAFFSHRISRWFLPFFLLAALVTNVVLMGDGLIYILLGCMQALLYGVALVGIVFPSAGRVSGLFSLSAYFVYSNAALFLGFFRWMSGRASHRWTPARS